MARTPGSNGDRTIAAIRSAAASLIARQGFEAMSMRQLAAEVGVQPAALYRYYPTQDVLPYQLMLTHLQAIIGAGEAARPACADPIQRLTAFVDNHIRYHLSERDSTHVSNMELRSLSEPRLGEILKLRSAYEGELRAILADGAGAGVFTVEDVRPRRSSAATSAYRVVATLASGRKVFGPRSFVRMPVDDVAPTAPGLVRRVGSYRGLVGLLRWGSSTDDQCVAGYMLEVRWPAWKPGIWEAQHAERTRGCGGASEGESWFEDLAPTTTPTFDLRRGTWLVRAVAVDHAGNRGVGPVSRIRIPAYVEDLGLESECRLVGPNVVCTYPKDDY